MAMMIRWCVGGTGVTTVHEHTFQYCGLITALAVAGDDYWFDYPDMKQPLRSQKRWKMVDHSTHVTAAGEDGLCRPAAMSKRRWSMSLKRSCW